MSNTNIRSFIPIQKLGQGSFASVYKVRRVEDQQIYALKKIKMNRLHQKAKQNSLNQVRFLASFSSPFIAKYYQAFFDQNLDVLCIVMEFAEGGDLRKLIDKHKKQKRLMTQIQIWKIMIHLVFGLTILHENKILHRDIKCENILISQGKYKIGDMNVSKVNKLGFVDTQTGTPYYSSPQVWKDQPYNQKSDIWSLGCILYEIATLRPPFMGRSMEELYKNVLKGTYSPIPRCYSNELSSVIRQCLEIFPLKRPSAQELMNNSSFKIYQNICLQSKISQAKMNVKMLQTICLPKDIRQLNQCLPKAKYHPQENQSKGMPDNKAKQILQQINFIKVIDKFEVGEQGESHISNSNEPKIQDKLVESIRQIKALPRQQLLLKSSQIVPKKQSMAVYQSLNHKVKSYSKLSSQTNKRRVLKQRKQQMVEKPRSRSKSLPRTQRKSMSMSKQLTQDKQNRQIVQKSCQMHINQKKIETENKKNNRYWNILDQAKKYLQRSMNKNKRLF